VRCALPPTGKHVTDATGVPLCEYNTGFLSQPGTNTSTANRSETETQKRIQPNATQPAHNHQYGCSATLRIQHQVPFATWHKYVNGPIPFAATPTQTNPTRLRDPTISQSPQLRIPNTEQSSADPVIHVPTASRSTKLTGKPVADAAGVPPCDHNTRFHSQPGTNTSTVSRSETESKSTSSPTPPEDNHRCGWSATLRPQHQVPFATWHKYVNGQPEGHGWKEEGFTNRACSRCVNRPGS
jgi:hypothetical protein